MGKGVTLDNGHLGPTRIVGNHGPGSTRQIALDNIQRLYIIVCKELGEAYEYYNRQYLISEKSVV